MYLVYNNNGKTEWISPVPDFDPNIIGGHLIVENIPDYDVKTQKLELYNNENTLEIRVVALDSNELDVLSNAQKESSVIEIDENTRSEIAKGFQYDGQTFSLSSNAQLNWNRLFLMHQSGLYKPQNISTIDNKEYLLTVESIQAFYNAYFTVINTQLLNGLSAKQRL